MRRMARPWPIVFTAEGLNIERFVRRAGESGIPLTGMKRPAPRRMTALVQENQLPLLQEIAMQGGWKLTVGSRKGTGRAADWLRSRWLLACGIIAAGAVLLMASQVIWRVEVLGGGTYDADIRSALIEWGIAPPQLRSQISLGELRDQLEWRYPRIAWFECGWRGSTLVIRAVEGNLPRTDDSNDGQRDIVAARDGIVHTIVTRAGTPEVKPGQIVRKGEVLIRGEERTAEGGVRPVAARGNVTARIWEGASVRLPAAEQMTVYTGQEQSVWTIRTPWFDLWRMDESPYEHYDTAVTEIRLTSYMLPIRLHMETRMEAEISRSPRDMAELKRDGERAALRKLQEKVGEGESLIDIWGNCSMIEDGTLLSVAIGERLVEIGMQVPSAGMAAPEENVPR